MGDRPQRSSRDIASQLGVIILLLAVLVGAIIFLDKYVTSHRSSSPPPKSAPAYNYSCCTGWNANAVYAPGETVHLKWQKTVITPESARTEKLTLTAFLSDRFASRAAIKASTKSGSFSVKSGPFVAATDRITLSNRSGSLPVSSLRIPGNAKSGYYAIAFTSEQKGFSVSSVETIRVT